MENKHEYCSWCNKPDDHEEICNECHFCEDPICCNCWDKDGTCFYPGEGYCPDCKEGLESCPDCMLYLKGLMTNPNFPMCKKHPWK